MPHLYLSTIYSLFFFFNATATTEIYTLSLHDALPILIAFDPKHGAFRGGLAQHGVMEAETLIRTGDAAGALERYKEALSFYSGLAGLDEHNLDARLNVAAKDVKIAATLLRLGRVDEAHETYQRALQVMGPAASSNALNQNQQAEYTLEDAYSG